MPNANANDEIFDRLSQFPECAGLSGELRELFKEFEEDGKFDTNEVERLRRELRPFSDNEDDLLRGDVVHKALLLLAKLYPTNTEDMSGDPITEENRVVISTGHHFDIDELIKWHNDRRYRRSLMGEAPDQKWLINPQTNDKMTVRDAQHVVSVARERGIDVNDLMDAQIGRQRQQQRTVLSGLMGRVDNPLTMRETMELLEGLSAEELIEIDRYKLSTLQIGALKKFREYGLRIWHLDQNKWFNTAEHHTALRELLLRNGLTLFSALEHMKGLSVSQLSGIEDLNRAEMRVLKDLRRSDLTAAHLRDNPSLNTDAHRTALRGLMSRVRNPLNADEAVGLLNSLKVSQLPEIGSLSVLQIRILKDLRDFNLKATDLRGKSWFSTEAHRTALVYLVTKKGSVDEAMLSDLCIIRTAAREYQMDVIKTACTNYLQFRLADAPGHRGLSFINSMLHLRMSHWGHGSDGVKRVTAVVNRNGDYDKMLESVKVAVNRSGFNKHSFRRFFHDAVVKDSKTVGEELSTELLEGMKEDVGRLIKMKPSL